MIGMCTNCGRTKSQAIADAKTLGLLQELQVGIYTCCQISEWADEQWFAWVEATRQDCDLVEDVITRPEQTEAEPTLVPLRLGRPQVPWFKDKGTSASS
jgi:hypothetical protein